MKQILSFIALILFCLASGKALYFAKEGFTARRVQGWNLGLTAPLTPEAELALSQRYHFLGRGRQCFAFASEDNCYVLKLPRTDKYKKSSSNTEIFFRESLRIAYEEFKDESALLAIHLGPTPSTGRILHITDALGLPIHLPLDKTTFLLQRKHTLLFPALAQALAKQNHTEAKKMLIAFTTLIQDRTNRHIKNRDEAFLDNYGYDGEKAYQIDIGDLYKSENISIEDALRPVKEWLSSQSMPIYRFHDLLEENGIEHMPHSPDHDQL